MRLITASSLYLWLRLGLVTGFLLALQVVRFFITVVYLLFPFPGMLDWLYKHSRLLPQYFSYQLRGGSDTLPVDVELDAADLIRLYNYPVEEHAVRTADGYILGVQRIPSGRRSSDYVSTSSADASSSGTLARRPSVLLLHGLMMSSEVWLLKREKSLPFLLADAGFDVWLGNVRGNKHSQKHVSRSPTDEAFWNFSLDELARDDLPSMVDYVRRVSGNDKIGYIGFSNGTATMFAALAHGHVRDKITNFVALAPAVTLKGIASAGAKALIQSGLDFVYLLFGTKQMLPLTTFYTRVLSTPLLVRILDQALWHLFSWRMSEIDDEEKRVIYYHFYSYTSVKSVVHWFQIIRAGRFQMYDDLQSSHGRPPVYDISNIDIAIDVFHGGQDTLIDAEALIKSLKPECVTEHYEPSYEHVDFLWARSVTENVFTRVVDTMARHSDDAAGSVRSSAGLLAGRSASDDQCGKQQQDAPAHMAAPA